MDTTVIYQAKSWFQKTGNLKHEHWPNIWVFKKLFWILRCANGITVMFKSYYFLEYILKCVSIKCMIYLIKININHKNIFFNMRRKEVDGDID